MHNKHNEPTFSNPTDLCLVVASIISGIYILFFI